MKKLTMTLLSALLALSLAACGNDNQDRETDTLAESPVQTGESESGRNTENGSVGSEDDGNPVGGNGAAGDGGSTENGNGAAGDGGSTENGNGVAGDGGSTDGGNEESGDGGSADGDNGASGSNILVAYFSVMETDGVDTVAGASRLAVGGEVLGNNQYIAQIIQRETGGDLFSIETVQEYPGTHEPLLDFAYEEKADDARPELATHIEDPDSYDIIFLGFPNWNADLPMPLYTFLEEYDFGGKTIVPFTTHGGSGFSRTIQTIAELQPDATVITDGLSISRNRVPEAESEVIDWINGLDLNN